MTDWQEKQALRSVRAVAADIKINHLTVMKGYQLLVDQGLVEKKRGQGMFVAKGALATLQHQKKMTTILKNTGYAQQLALDNISFELNAGQVLGLLYRDTFYRQLDKSRTVYATVLLIVIF